jgi:tetratricopeptide (TPR) repeat protein
MVAPLLVLLAGAVVYLNSFAVPFLLDDYRFLSDPAALAPAGSWWALWRGTTRPLARLSFALNHAVGGPHVWGYHLVNVLIHLGAALVLFGIVRRTLLTAPLRARYGQASGGLALATALLWIVHPLHTQSVTYLSQRAESLMGLCYLLVLYALIRGHRAPHPRRWAAASLLACAFGMMSKPVMATAPLLVLLYDRVFLSGSFRAALRARPRYYLGLALTWVIPAVLLSAPNDSTTSAGLALMEATETTPLAYAMTQPGVVLHYLRLLLWPHPLCFDYGWPLARGVRDVAFPAIVIGGLLLAVLWALRRRPPLGFVGAWFFVILAPTSSVIPLADPAFEHRMYLPLAAPVVLAVLAGYHAAAALIPSGGCLRRRAAAGLLAALVLGLGGLTLARNHQYRSELSIWSDTVAQRPMNARAHNNLGRALAKQGALDQSIPHFAEALRLKPDYADAYYNMGLAFAKTGRLNEAIAHFSEALRLNPRDGWARGNLELARDRQRQADQALRVVEADHEQPWQRPR